MFSGEFCEFFINYRIPLMAVSVKRRNVNKRSQEQEKNFLNTNKSTKAHLVGINDTDKT